MSTLWQPWHLGSLEIPNRLVRSATWEGLADGSGRPRPALAARLGEVAAGGAGLVVAGFTWVVPEGRGLDHQGGLADDDNLAAWAEVAAAIHAGGAASCLQLGHAGAQLWSEAMGPGEGPGGPGAEGEAMTAERLAVVAEGFAAAADRARAAGFGAVQIHVAHGYLLSAFLSPRTNRRTDAYGGEVGGRARYGVEVIRAVRQRVGADYPVWAKWNGCDHVPGGLEPVDSLAAARLAVAAGLDGLEISGGVRESAEAEGTTRGPEAEEGYFAPVAVKFAAALEVPVGVVGGVRTPGAAAALLARGLAFVSLSRPLICEPDLPRRWREGDPVAAGCVACNRCFIPALRGKGIRCLGRRRK